MISCSEAVRRLWEYLDKDLDAPERDRVDAHLALCRRCCGEAEFTAALRDMLQQTRGPQLPSDVEEHLVGFLDTLEGGSS
ncbi:MAG TPA: zf-HC2 domain-containing protein [Egibacteraceae bacterium]|jgi:anti-sigma factor (TIGR02949 family)|nr:zf-HC2 domain-containing protein [Egibacteraceae bacterium]